MAAALPSVEEFNNQFLVTPIYATYAADQRDLPLLSLLVFIKQNRFFNPRHAEPSRRYQHLDTDAASAMAPCQSDFLTDF